MGTHPGWHPKQPPPQKAYDESVCVAPIHRRPSIIPSFRFHQVRSILTPSNVGSHIRTRSLPINSFFSVIFCIFERLLFMGAGLFSFCALFCFFISRSSIHHFGKHWEYYKLVRSSMKKQLL